MATADDVALPYHEPGIVAILVLASFLLLLNVAHHLVDKLLYCGLLVQIVLGIAWGVPGGDWLGRDIEHAVVKLGYLGLILIVFEGGLLTSFKALKSNLPLSTAVAVTGITLPIASSYFLPLLVGASPLQAFAAGAALCSTSLGTTFSLLSASGLSITRLGTVLTSAAMMDDVVGLVMVQVISNLDSSSTFTATDVIRPALVSLAFVVAVPLAARFVVRPLTVYLNRLREAASDGRPLNKIMGLSMLPWFMHTTILVTLVTAAVYSGTSGLFAAYLAGASITWWDREVPHTVSSETIECQPSSGQQSSGQQSSHCTVAQTYVQETKGGAAWKGADTFEANYAQPLRRILQPFFFASIGFSIPISRMFTGTILWKGIIYTTLMFLAKFVCGFWLMRVPGLTTRALVRVKPKSGTRSHSENGQPRAPNTNDPKPAESPPASSVIGVPSQGIISHRPQHDPEPESVEPSEKLSSSTAKQHSTETSPKPISLYPGCILGCAMVARGEIGFLISAIAESKGIYGEEPNGPIFLVVTWAIMLCTIIGPLLVGTLVKRVKHLELRSSNGASAVLGIWGTG